jgi:hypothetical protein
MKKRLGCNEELQGMDWRLDDVLSGGWAPLAPLTPLAPPLAGSHPRDPAQDKPEDPPQTQKSLFI